MVFGVVVILDFPLSIIPVILGIPFAYFVCWMPYYLISSLLGPHFSRAHSQGGSFDLGNHSQSWAFFFELVL